MLQGDKGLGLISCFTLPSPVYLSIWALPTPWLLCFARILCRASLVFSLLTGLAERDWCLLSLKPALLRVGLTPSGDLERGLLYLGDRDLRPDDLEFRCLEFGERDWGERDLRNDISYIFNNDLELCRFNSGEFDRGERCRFRGELDLFLRGDLLCRLLLPESGDWCFLR